MRIRIILCVHIINVDLIRTLTYLIIAWDKSEKEICMSTYVLIHGDWHGGWCWQKVYSLPTSHSPFISAPEQLAACLIDVADFLA